MKKRLGKILEEESKIMIKQFNEARKLTGHKYQQGYFYEEILRLFFKKFLPPSLDVARGFIIDSKDNISNEIDLVIFDKNSTPVFYSAGDLRIIPIETVYAVIEVKTRISPSILEKEIFPHLESINKLKKYSLLNPNKYFGGLETKKLEAVYSNLKDNNIGEEYIPVNVTKANASFGKWKETDWPIIYGIFAFESSKLPGMRDMINKYHNKKELKSSEKIDSVCVLGKGVIMNLDKGLVKPAATENSEMWCVENKQKALKHFLGMLTDILLGLEIRGGIRYSDYYLDTKNKKS